jgi:hypothetical protein
MARSACFVIVALFLILEVLGQTKRIYDNEGCKSCIDRGWTNYCTNSTRVPGDSSQGSMQGFCCDGYFLLNSPTFCNPSLMTCSNEIDKKALPTFRYSICP